MTISSSALNRYLARLPDGPHPQSSLWRAADGSVQGQFFACALGSAFQPVYALGLTGRQLAGFGPVHYRSGRAAELEAKTPAE